MSAEIDGVNYVVLGIGLNVNMSASLLDKYISMSRLLLLMNAARILHVQNWFKAFCTSLNKSTQNI